MKTIVILSVSTESIAKLLIKDEGCLNWNFLRIGGLILKWTEVQGWNTLYELRSISFKFVSNQETRNCDVDSCKGWITKDFLLLVS